MNDTSEYLQMFMDETGEQLEALVEVLLVLEREPASVDELNEAFRLIHSIKGAAGMMGFDNITVLTHHMESRFEALRSGLVKFDEPTMNLVLRCIDFLGNCVRGLREGEQLGGAGDLLEELAALGESATEAPPQPDPEPPPLRAAEVASNVEVTTATAFPDDADTHRLTVRFEPDLPLADLKASLIISRLSQMGEIVSTRPAAKALENAEALSQLVVVLTSEQPAEVIRAAADVDGVRSVELTGGCSEPASVVAADVEPEPTFEAPEPESKTEEPELEAEPESKTAEPEPEPQSGPTPPPQAQVQVQARTPAGDRSRPKVTETMRVGIDRLDDLLNLAGELVVNRARFVQVAGRVGTAFRKRNVVSRARDFGERLNRIVEHLQSLSDTNGELTRDIEELKAGVALIAEQDELWERGRKGFSQISEAIEQLTRISDSLQKGVLQTRMVPVRPLFNRFNRVVRDLSTERGKKVSLSIRGEKTELDKRMIDELGDPLLHLVRNSIDHGLEPPEVRLARGKSEAGTIFLEALQSGNSVLVSIRDDGGGIDVARIKERLLERELLAPSAIAGLSDEQALEYVWHPGFSTAREVTDISGRGVGMDAVRARISELNGTIDVESVPEQGTTFTIRLPLTLAIINSLLMRIRGVIFSIPIDDVREIVKIPAADTVTVQERQTIDVRGEFIPLICITDVFEWQDVSLAGTALPAESKAANGDDINAVILRVGERVMALCVDELLGSQEIVIKSLSQNFVPIRGLSGASILGDGTVCLMLDVGRAMDLVVARKKKKPDLDRAG